MAIKFWFAKKESDQAGRSAVSDGQKGPVLSNEAAVADAATSQASVVAQEPVKEAEVLPAKEATGQPLAAPVGVASKPVEAPVAPAAVAGPEPAKSPAAAEAPKLVLKPVLKPVGAPSAAAGAAGRTAFGLRPKGDAAVAVPVVASAAPATAAAAPAAAPASAAAAVVPPATVAATGSAEPEKKSEPESSVAIRPKTDQRALYYQLMNGLYDAVLLLDDQGHVIDCNSRVTEMLGYTREEAWDLPIGKVITGMVSQMFEHLKRNLTENNHVLIDARCFRKDGSSFAGEVGVSTITLTRGHNLVFAIRNVERRKSAMDDLRKSQAALDIALAPTFVCDTDGFFVVVNQMLLEAFGIPDADQAKGVRFMDLIPDAARLFLRASCGEKVRETLSVPTPDGLQVKVQLALTPVQSGQNVTGVAGSILQM